MSTSLLPLSIEELAAEHAYLLAVISPLLAQAQAAIDHYAGKRSDGPRLPLSMAKTLLRDLDINRIQAMRGSILDVARVVARAQDTALEELFLTRLQGLPDELVVWRYRAQWRTAKGMRREIEARSAIARQYFVEVLRQSPDLVVLEKDESL